MIEELYSEFLSEIFLIVRCGRAGSELIIRTGILFRVERCN